MFVICFFLFANIRKSLRIYANTGRMKCISNTCRSSENWNPKQKRRPKDAFFRIDYESCVYLTTTLAAFVPFLTI